MSLREQLIRRYYENHPLTQEKLAAQINAMQEYSKVPEVQRKRNLGKAIAQLYIAAQHTNMMVSDTVCDLMGKLDADPWVKFGFNQEMDKSPYMTRAETDS